uniref:Structural polyprotein n=2 Tax=Venezuelan equine encephalitis virus TaxID=11036 RepID=A0A499PT50_EEVV|nr:structural polyprotein [Venezuelan equine encephalitis virus]AVP73339.1 structural polyprotein [Venezuelan equine encephalitis virus]AVP73341.1 structural polyprotein [Venezuelan equine encephalitis virus]
MFPYQQTMFPMQPVPFRNPYAPPRRPWFPRTDPFLAMQVQELARSMANLTFKQRRDTPPEGPPAKKKRKEPQQQAAQAQGKKKNGKTKKKKRNGGPPPKNQSGTKKKVNKKPGKRQRMVMKLESDKTFPIMLDGKINGYACVVGGKLFRPMHVEGKIDNDTLASLKTKKASKYDLEYADVPQSMRADTFKYTHEKPQGYYNWHHGAVQYENGRFTVPKGVGAKGDSGRPILDNQGRVVAIVLGGVNEGSRTALSVVMWNEKGVTVKYTPENCEQWSLVTTMCLLANVTFPCSTPPMCYDRKPAETLALLSANVDNPGYDELLEAVLKCPGRQKRSTEELFKEYKLTRPYMAKCIRCAVGSCHSPIAIEAVKSDGHDGYVRLQTSSQYGLDPSGNLKGRTMRYDMHGTIEEVPLHQVSLHTSRPCHIIDGHGYFLLARCPEGDSITMEFKKDSVTHSCSVPYEVKFTPVGRELYSHPPEHGTEHPCHVYAHDAQRKDAYVEMHLPGSEVDSTLLSMSGSSVQVTPPAGQSVLVECDCGSPVSETINTAKTYNQCTKTTQCRAYRLQNDKWVYNSDKLPKASGDTLKGKLHVPYLLSEAKCTVPLAPEPIITFGFRSISLKLHPRNPTYLTTRSLDGEPNHTHELISEPTTRNFTVTESGWEFVWGNHPPQRYWAQETAPGNPHGLPHEVITHYYHRYPMSTILGLSICAAVVTTAVAASTWLLCKSRASCLTPYRLTPNAQLPVCLAVLCCARTARAETTWESLDHLWNHNQQMFWSQLLIPLAALIVVTRLLKCMCCVVPFLVLAGAANVGAYEHATTMPNQVGIPYNTVVNRAGYAPLAISVTPTKVRLIPTLNLEYITCHYKTGLDSPSIKCCGSQECPKVYRPDEQCKVFTGVYPFMWGGAYCFCDSENTQVSRAYVTKSDDCSTDHALAYKAHTASVQAFLNITVGEQSTTAVVYVNGETPISFNGVKLVAGPLSTAWTPFDRKVVQYAGEIYNYDFPEYGAGHAGAFGDLQARTTTSNDLYANTNLILQRPNTGTIHVPYTQAPSGFEQWKKDRPPSLKYTAPFGCEVHINPVRAENCAVGSIPLAFDIPDALFTRVSETPTLSSAECSLNECVYSSDFGGIATVKYSASKAGKCAVHIPSGTATLKESSVDVTEQGSLTLHFSTANIHPEFKLQICTTFLTCKGDCHPPKDHIVSHPQHHAQTFTAAVSKTAWTWLTSLLGGSAVIIIIGLVLATIVAMYVLTNQKHS